MKFLGRNKNTRTGTIFDKLYSDFQLSIKLVFTVKYQGYGWGHACPVWVMPYGFGLDLAEWVILLRQVRALDWRPDGPG